MSIDLFEMVKPKMGNAILEAVSDFVAVPAANRAQKRKMDRYAQKYCKNRIKVDVFCLVCLWRILCKT